MNKAYKFIVHIDPSRGSNSYIRFSIIDLHVAMAWKWEKEYVMRPVKIAKLIGVSNASVYSALEKLLHKVVYCYELVDSVQGIDMEGDATVRNGELCLDVTKCMIEQAQ